MFGGFDSLLLACKAEPQKALSSSLHTGHDTDWHSCLLPALPQRRHVSKLSHRRSCKGAQQHSTQAAQWL